MQQNFLNLKKMRLWKNRSVTTFCACFCDVFCSALFACGLMSFRSNKHQSLGNFKHFTISCVCSFVFQSLFWNRCMTCVGKGKVTVKLSLCLTKHHTMKMYWRSGGITPCILDLSTRWRWVVSFMPQPLYPRERVPGTHCIGGWVGPKASLDAVVKGKIPSHYWDLNPCYSVHSPVLYHWAILAHHTNVGIVL
jgi:hypothetical protein